MLTIKFQAGFAAALELLAQRLLARTFDNLLRDTVGRFVGAASRRLLGVFVEDARFARVQQLLAGWIPGWIQRLPTPEEE